MASCPKQTLQEAAHWCHEVRQIAKFTRHASQWCVFTWLNTNYHEPLSKSWQIPCFVWVSFHVLVLAQSAKLSCLRARDLQAPKRALEFAKTLPGTSVLGSGKRLRLTSGFSGWFGLANILGNDGTSLHWNKVFQSFAKSNLRSIFVNRCTWVFELNKFHV